jgi:hypothetical protein
MQLGLEGLKITKLAAGAASAGTAVTGSTLDMAGYAGVLLISSIATANAGNYLKAQGGAAFDGSDAADIAGSKTIAAANAEAVVIDLNRPLQRYITPVLIRGGANTATGDIWAVQYNPNTKPQTSDVTNVLISNTLKSPALGTP